uniref:Claudin-like protein n=1 Tax=Macrostomum lignano TaxID=282301 RepID=A0A1I8HLP6_9PLAT
MGSAMPNGLAPIVRVDRILVGRPIKVLAFMMSLGHLFFIMIAIASSSWIVSDSTCSGLWEECWTRNNVSDCTYRPANTGYSAACGVLMLSAALISGIAATSYACGMLTKDSNKKAVIYTFTIGLQGVSALVESVALIAFPISHMREISERRAPQTAAQWDIGWAYYIGWVSVLSVIVAMVMLFLDMNSEELVYRERVTRCDEVDDNASE